MRLHVQLLHPNARLPLLGSDGAAGIDLYLLEPLVLSEPLKTVYVPLGIAVAIPKGFEGQLRPRSSVSRRGVHVALGTIDSDYRGELGIVVTRLCPGTESGPIIFGTAEEPHRICQLVIAPVASVVPVAALELSQTARGAKGWGSTGS